MEMNNSEFARNRTELGRFFKEVNRTTQLNINTGGMNLDREAGHSYDQHSWGLG
jgi:hypothetical protein